MSRATAVKKRNVRATTPYAAPAMMDDEEPTPVAPVAAPKKAAAKKAATKAKKTDIVVMSDDAAPIPAPAAPVAAAPAAAETAAPAAYEPTEPFDVTVDPRPRHKREYHALVQAMDALKKERDGYTKAWEQQLKRKEITERLRVMETAFRTRTKSEVEAFLATLTPEQIKNDPIRLAVVSRKRDKKNADRTRKSRRYGGGD